ncbi:MAG: hypothetical protein H6642_07125 [Caldilineaceae bacterium]|nr:hypothetical protein [Caldilineaceae bacterium]
MQYRRSKRFTKSFGKLPSNIQAKAKKALALFAEQPTYPYHPSLEIKKIKGRKRNDEVWEGRVDIYYRFTFSILTAEDGEMIVYLRNIGGHDIIPDHA